LTLPESPPGPRAFDGRAVLALVAVQMCYATFPVLGKIAMREIPPFVVAAFRAVSGAVLLALAARVLAPDAPKFDRRDRWTLAGLSALGIVSAASRSRATSSWP
jgi:drug/metabolite transporter (DMT)-like permease